MKVSKLSILLFILVVSLILSTFWGSNIKEGITYNVAIVLSNLLENTNESNASRIMTKIAKMKIDDPNYEAVIENTTLSDYQKVVHLRELLKIISSDMLSNQTLDSALSTDIALDHSVKSVSK
jgi:hypothetical protein